MNARQSIARHGQPSGVLADGDVPSVRRHCCHVVAVTPNADAVATIQTQAGWLLPFVESTRFPELLDPLRALLEDSIGVIDLVHLAPLSRVASAPVQASYALSVLSGRELTGRLTLVPPALLASAHALLPTQRAALATALARLRMPEAMFDTVGASTAALEWVRRQLAERCGAALLSTTPHRCLRHERVVRLDTTAGPMYFKAGRERVEDEAVLTEKLWTLSPSQFPHAVAIDDVHHRWLYRSLDGKPLTGPLLTKDTVAMAVTALARLQQRALHDAAVRDHLRVRHMNATELYRRVAQAVRCAFQREARSAGPASEGHMWDASAGAIVRRCEEVDAHDLPMTLVLSDFWTRNIIRTVDGIGFIDVEHSFWSYPILSLWRFIQDVTPRRGIGDGLRELIERTFATEWCHTMAPPETNALIAHLPLLGGLFELLTVSRDLDLEERALGSELSPEYRAQRLAPRLRSVFEEIHRPHRLTRASTL